MGAVEIAKVMREKIRAAEHEAAFIVVDDVKRFTKALGAAELAPPAQITTCFSLPVRENVFMLFGTYALVRQDGTAISVHKYA